MKVLITRTDKLGDLVLSEPAMSLLKEARPNWEIHAMVAPDSMPLVENNPHLARIWTWSDQMTKPANQQLQDSLKAEGFGAVVMLQFRQELAAVFRRAGIKRRYGPLSKRMSWLLLNRGLRQKRSHGQHHEMDYNLQLVKKLIGDNPDGHATLEKKRLPQLFLTESQEAVGSNFRSTRAAQASQVVFLHPGSGGSALDWQPGRFAAVANSLAQQKDWQVFITGSGQDKLVVDQIRPLLAQNVEVLFNCYSLPDFLGILSAGDLFIGPSTGPLHIAAALGLAVVGLFPPVKTMSPDRWGPRGLWCAVVEPQVKCPASRFCSLEKCEHFNCMDQLFEQDVLAAAHDISAQRQQR